MAFIFSNWSKEKYVTHLEKESKSGEQSPLKQHVQYRRAQDYGMNSALSVDHNEKTRQNHDEELKVFHLVIHGLQEELGYWTYCFLENSSHHDDQGARTVWKCAEQPQLHLKPQTLD